VHDDVAGIGGAAAVPCDPGSIWLSLRHDKNTPGAYAAGMLNAQPSVS
jgi:hypothetical protein